MTPAETARRIDDVCLLMARVARLQRELRQANAELIDAVAVLQQREAALGRTDR